MMTRQKSRNQKKPLDGVEKSFGDNDATGLLPPPTADSVLSRASSRNNVNESNNQQDLLQAQADQKIPPPQQLPQKMCTISNGNEVKVDNVPCGNLETVYEDKTDAAAAVCSEHEPSA